MATELGAGFIRMSVKYDDTMSRITKEITGIETAGREAGRKAGDAISDGLESGASKAGDKVGSILGSVIGSAAGSIASQLGTAVGKAGAEAAKDLGRAILSGNPFGGVVDAARGLGGNLKAAGAVAGGALIGALAVAATKGAESVMGTIADKLGSAAAKGSALVSQKVSGITASFANVQSDIGNLKTLLGGNDTWAAPGLDLFQGLLDQVSPALQGVSSLSSIAASGVTLFSGAAKAAAIAQGLFNIALTANPIGLIVTAVGALVAGLVLFFTKTEIGRKIVTAAWDGIKTSVSVAWGVIKGALDGAGIAIHAVGDAATWLWHNAFEPAWNGIKAGLGAAWDFMKGIFDKIKSGFGSLKEGVVAAANGIRDGVKAAFSGLVGIIKAPLHMLGRFLQGIPDLPIPGVGALRGWGGTLANLRGGGVAGVDANGQLFGPGTGTSDSILAVGANGVPTALVSQGEGVVKKRAMDNGGDKVVAALNAGLRLPGFDDGGVIPPPGAPGPQIKVPEATTGQAGDFNEWIQAQHGKAYQYGTLYDCSGFMSQIYNKLTGKQMPRFNTESDLAAYGFVRGTKPGTFQLGIHHGGGGPNSHMAGTLPDGRNVESGGKGVVVGSGTLGAFDPQFEDHWYLPGSESMGGAVPIVPKGSDGGNPLAALTADAASQSDAGRTEGYIPAGAGGSGKAGSSFASGLLGMGAQAINGLIDQAASAASSAAGMGANMFAPGSGGAASGAANAAIGMGTQAAKRGVEYGFQLAGIGIDAAAEILMPFGVPRFFNTDPMQFVPQLPNQPAAVTTGEKAVQEQLHPGSGANPGGPVQPGQLPGQQPVGAPVQKASPEGVMPAAPPIQPKVSGPAVAPVPNAPVVKPPLQPQDLGGLLGAPQPKTTGNPVLDQMLADRTGALKYDRGGWLMPGGVAVNASKRPEPILNDEQWGNLHAIAGQGMPAPDPKAFRGGDDYSVRIENVTVTDVQALQREIDSRQRLAVMRYAGRP